VNGYSDLSGVHDALDRLPEVERTSWRTLWDDVQVILTPQSSYQLPRQLALAGDWTGADADADAFQRAPSNNGERWYEYACVRLLAGDPDGYRKACATMLQRRGQLDLRPYHLARACTLAPDAVPDLVEVARLAEKELKDHAAEFWALTEQGALAYRAGRCEEAAALLEKCVQVKQPEGAAARNAAWLALARQRLGQSEKAAPALKQAVQWLEKHPAPLVEDSGTRLHLHDWLEAKLLCREAETLLQKK